MAPKRKQPESNISFLVSTPDNLGDQQSLAVLQYQARAHAARIAHSPSHKAKLAADPQNPRQRNRRRKEQPSSLDSSPSSQYERLGRGQTDETYDVDDIGNRALSKIGRQRQREDLLNIHWPRTLPPTSVDPLYFIPYPRHNGVYVALGHYVNVSAPTVRPVYEIFDITSTHTSLLLEFMMKSEAFYHGSIARLLITANNSYGPGPGALDDAMITYHQTLAMKQLREEIETTQMPTDMMLLTILFLITIDVAIGQASSLDIHRKHLAKCVALRGGLDALGHNGLVKATIQQFEDVFTFERGPSPLLARVEYLCRYPSRPFTQQMRVIISSIPEGFQRLAEQDVLPIDIIELLFRITHAVQRSKGGRTYVPLSTTENPFHSQKRTFTSFSEACPCLFASDDEVPPLIKALSMALAIWCFNAYSSSRWGGLVVTGFLHSLTRRLQHESVTTSAANDQSPSGAQSSDERECWIWIWLVCIDAHVARDGRTLLPVGNQLLKCFKARYPPEAADVNILDRVLCRFFCMDYIRVRVSALWQDTPDSSPS